MTTVAEFATSNYTFTTTDSVRFDIDTATGEQALVTVRSGSSTGAIIFQMVVTTTAIYGPFNAGDYLTVYAKRGTVDYTIVNQEATHPLSDAETAALQTRLSSEVWTLRDNGSTQSVRFLPREFWTDDATGVDTTAINGRVFVGEATQHTGSRVGDLGTFWLDTVIGSWFSKNSQMIVGSENGRMALLCASRTSDNPGGAVAIGVSGVVLNDQASGSAWGLYSDITSTNGAQTYGLEIAAKNQGADITGNAYSLSGGVLGLHVVGGGDPSYGGAATAASTVALNVARGATAIGAWNMGIRFASNALTGCDGTTGTAVAVAMAKGHELSWASSSSLAGAKIRSDVTAVSGQDVGLVFENSAVTFKGTGLTANIARMTHTASGVNNIVVSNAATGGYPAITCEGSDASVGLFIYSKSTAPVRIGQSGGNDSFRITPTASSVNYLNATGATAGNPAVLSTLGSDTNIDIYFSPKGTGVVRFGTFSSNADAPITGYVTIKTADGTTRKLATIA